MGDFFYLADNIHDIMQSTPFYKEISNKFKEIETQVVMPDKAVLTLEFDDGSFTRFSITDIVNIDSFKNKLALSNNIVSLALFTNSKTSFDSLSNYYDRVAQLAELLENNGKLNTQIYGYLLDQLKKVPARKITVQEIFKSHKIYTREENGAIKERELFNNTIFDTKPIGVRIKFYREVASVFANKPYMVYETQTPEEIEITKRLEITAKNFSNK